MCDSGDHFCYLLIYLLSYLLTHSLTHSLTGRYYPSLHLTTSKAMVIVWRLRGNIIRTVSYCHCATSSMGTVNKDSLYSPVGPWVCLFYVFRLKDSCLCSCMFCFTLDSCHFHSCFGAGITNLNEPLSSFFALYPLLWIRSWLHPFLGPLRTKRYVRRGGYLCRWSSTTE